jgi:hypothetical protein
LLKKRESFGHRLKGEFWPIAEWALIYWRRFFLLTEE